MDVSERSSTAFNLTADERERLSVELDAAYRERSLVPAPCAQFPGFGKADALDIAERVRDLRISGGHRPAGYKVGFTNAAVREQFSARAPLAATVYRETLTEATSVDAGSLLLPRIEPEIVVGLGSDGDIAWAALGFEIVQSHVAHWNFSYLDAIADFGLHAALVIGERRALDRAGLERLATMRVELSRGPEVIERGGSADVDGGPSASIEWLRTDLSRVGRRLLPGELISTGSMTRVPAIVAGERWTIAATANELPALTIDVT